jgi:prepilin signal peptidase PulO-like enzyme (type II secretory pathway)
VPYFLFFFIGAAIGSFTLVIVNRLHVAPIINGRSKCLSCSKKLAWYELIPVISYLIQRGKCRACEAKIGYEHVLVEVVYGLLYILLYSLFLKDKGINITSAWWAVYYSAMFVVSGVLVMYDLRHRLVPEYFLYAFVVLSAVMMMVRFFMEHNVYEFMTPFILSVPSFFLYHITKKRGIGLGDVVLFSGVGMFLGTEAALASLIISVWSAAIIGITLQMFNSRQYHMKYALPFVPFMIIAMFFVLFTDINVWTLVGLFS